MSLWIEVHVGHPRNNKLVASARADNISNLADLSDYYVIKKEFGEERLGIKPQLKEGEISCHDRRQSVWFLVEKIAAMQGEDVKEEE